MGLLFGLGLLALLGASFIAYACGKADGFAQASEQGCIYPHADLCFCCKRYYAKAGSCCEACRVCGPNECDVIGGPSTWERPGVKHG